MNTVCRRDYFLLVAKFRQAVLRLKHVDANCIRSSPPKDAAFRDSVGDAEQSVAITPNKKHAEKPLLMVGDDACDTHGIAPAGIEETQDSRGKQHQGNSVVTPVVTSAAIDSDLQAVIDAWPTLSGKTRKAIVNLIRKP